MSIPTLSFCITCKNRFYQVSQTLLQNLDNNRLHKKWIEFILVDFGSIDGLQKWVISNFTDDLKSGYLKYYYTDELLFWHSSIAKNTAHWCAGHDIVVNLDCDNYTGFLGGQYIIRRFLDKNDIVCHQFSGNIPDGSYGRIAILKKFFDSIGGYDESLGPIFFEDVDLINRLRRIGLEYLLLNDKKYCKTISNTREESLSNTGSSHDYYTINDLNKKKSAKNIKEGRIKANNGQQGIRQNMFDYRGKLFQVV